MRTRVIRLAAVGAAAALCALSIAGSPATAGPKQNGVYKGKVTGKAGKDPINQGNFKMRVTNNGRKLKKFYVVLNVICSSLPPYVEPHPIAFPTVKIKKNGKFKRVWKPNRDSRIMLKGRLKGRKIRKGVLDYRVGICVRKAKWSARRVR